MNTTETANATPRVATREEWLRARTELLKKEKAATRQNDELSRERRALPWVKLTTPYRFEGAEGKVEFAKLFGNRSQLVIYHFMFGPGWGDGCKSCSFVSDHFDGMLPHLAARDIAFAVVSHAPYTEIAPFRRRMGWRFPWYSSFGTSFNQDFHVSFDPAEVETGLVEYNFNRQKFPVEEAPGMSVFARNAAGEVFHTYSVYSRGLDQLMGTYRVIDFTPKGRNEDGLEHAMSWVRYHDDYEPAAAHSS